MNQKPITLTNLTAEQVEMLEILWSLTELSEVEEFQATLSDQEREMCDTLIRLIILETVDDIVCEDLSQAQAVLKKFQL
jgi:16S rRNA C1402 (ribose-2'-O) methylase RsmI